MNKIERMGDRVNKIEYVVGKSRSREGADSLAERTQALLDATGLGQNAYVTEIKNGAGSYGWRVNVTRAMKRK